MQFNHDGKVNRGAYISAKLIYDDIAGGNQVVETADYINIDNDNDWGTTGSTASVSSNMRWKVDDADSSIAYLQINLDSNYLGGFVEATGAVHRGDSVDVLSID